VDGEGNWASRPQNCPTKEMWTTKFAVLLNDDNQMLCDKNAQCSITYSELRQVQPGQFGRAGKESKVKFGIAESFKSRSNAASVQKRVNRRS
jgi:hypothetical protein